MSESWIGLVYENEICETSNVFPWKSSIFISFQFGHYLQRYQNIVFSIFYVNFSLAVNKFLCTASNKYLITERNYVYVYIVYGVIV